MKISNRQNRLLKLNLGCGLTAPEGWVNVDGSWGVLLVKYPLLRKFLTTLRVFPKSLLNVPWNANIVVHDLRKKLPFPSSSVGLIYSSHTLEHLYLSEAKKLLRECCRVLSPGGVLRVVVPDLREMALRYLNGGSPENHSTTGNSSADQFMGTLLLRPETPPQGNIFRKLYQVVNDFQSHKWMYDADSLRSQFELACFTDVRAMTFRASRIEEIALLETEGRYLEGPQIYIEGVK